MLFLGSYGFKFDVVEVNLLLKVLEVGLGSSMAFTNGVDLLGEHAQSSLLVIALLTDGGQTLRTLAQVGLQFRFFQRKRFDHGVQRLAAGRIPHRLGQFCCPLTDLMLEFVHAPQQAFGTRLGLLSLAAGLGEIDLKGVEFRMGVFQRNGVLLAAFARFTCKDLGSVSLLFGGFDLCFEDRLGLVEFVNGLFSFLKPSSQTCINGSDGLLRHDRQRFGNVGPVRFEFQGVPSLLQGLQAGLKAEQVVQKGLEGCLSGFGPCSNR